MLHIQYLNGKQQKWLNCATVTKIYFARIHSPALHNISFKKRLLKKKRWTPQTKNFKKKKKWYCSYYPHRLRDSVFAVCGIFINIQNLVQIYYLSQMFVNINANAQGLSTSKLQTVAGDSSLESVP